MSSRGVRCSSRASSPCRVAISSSERLKIWCDGGGRSGGGGAAASSAAYAPQRALLGGARAGQVRAEGGRAALRRDFGENVRHVRQIRGPEAGHDVVLVVLRRGAPEDLDQGAQLGRLDAALEPQGADAVGVHPEREVLAQVGVRVDRLPAAEDALVREVQMQGAELLEVLLDAPRRSPRRTSRAAGCSADRSRSPRSALASAWTTRPAEAASAFSAARVGAGVLGARVGHRRSRAPGTTKRLIGLDPHTACGGIIPQFAATGAA